MFIRFRQTRNRLQCSLIETRRVDGKVQHEHIASLGTVPLAPSIADRIAFWTALHQRLGKLSNRIVDEMKYKLVGQVHAKIPMPTTEEQRDLQRQNAEADERFWSSLQDMHSSSAAEHKELITKAQRSVEKHETDAANAADRSAIAGERLAKIKNGEDVAGGFGKPIDIETMMLANGFTKRDLRYMRRFSTLMNELESRGIADDYWKMREKFDKASRRQTERMAEREVLRKHGLQWNDE